jgi:polyisoprenoid-binding protein YceI
MRARFAGIAVVALCLAACAPPVSRPTESAGSRPSASAGQPPDGFPDAYYLDLARRGQAAYEVDPAGSRIVIEVRRGGSLAQLGHDHVVVSHDVAGYVAPAEGRADLYVRLDRLVVDEPTERAEAHFDSQPPDDAIAGTRENMLRKLDAAEHPFAVIAVRGVDRDATGSWLNATLALNGTSRALRIPAEIALAGDGVSVAGKIAFTQTSFGITPYSILAGALQVQDEVTIRFRVRARRIAL